MSTVTELSAIIITLHLLVNDEAPERQNILHYLSILSDKVNIYHQLTVQQFLYGCCSFAATAITTKQPNLQKKDHASLSTVPSLYTSMVDTSLDPSKYTINYSLPYLYSYYNRLLSTVLVSLTSIDDVFSLIQNSKYRIENLWEEQHESKPVTNTLLRPGEAQLIDHQPVPLTTTTTTIVTEDNHSSSSIFLQPHLIPLVKTVDRKSTIGLLLRSFLLTMEARLFDGIHDVYRSIQSYLLSLPTVPTRENVKDMVYPLPSLTMLRFSTDTKGVTLSVTPTEFPTPYDIMKIFPSTPSKLREIYTIALNNYDFPAALDILHTYLDTGFGQAINSSSPTIGNTTPLGIFTGTDAYKNNALYGLTGPAVRVKELLLSSLSTPPINGLSLGRTLLHYAPLFLASLYAYFGYTNEASDALRECIRTAQANGDTACANYVLELLASLQYQQQQQQSTTGSYNPSKKLSMKNDKFRTLSSFSLSLMSPSSSFSSSSSFLSTFSSLNPETVDLLRRIRYRANDLGLWRQQIAISLQLMEYSIIHEARLLSYYMANHPLIPILHPRLSIPDWLSIDPYTSYRTGGYRIGVVSFSSVTTGSTGAIGAITTIAPTITASGRDNLGAVAITPLTNFTSTIAAATAKRSRAIYEYRPTLDGNLPSLMNNNDNGSSAGKDGNSNVTPIPGSSAIWSTPTPLTWEEICQVQAEGHASRANIWSEIHRQIFPITSQLLVHTAEKCEMVARQFLSSVAMMDTEEKQEDEDNKEGRPSTLPLFPSFGVSSIDGTGDNGNTSLLQDWYSPPINEILYKLCQKPIV